MVDPIDPSSTHLFAGKGPELRSPERIARLAFPHSLEASLEGISVQTVLDVGTGTGLFAQGFAALGLQVFALDLRKDLLDQAVASVPAGHFCIARAERLPFAEGSADLVFMAVVLHEAADRLRVLQEARRVAKHRVAILEWPYRSDGHGPPIEHRVRREALLSGALTAGFSSVETRAFPGVDLYLLRP
jgi:ubiquinone/menaquinone biosynthesis C-methylase UbiE